MPDRSSASAGRADRGGGTIIMLRMGERCSPAAAAASAGAVARDEGRPQHGAAAAIGAAARMRAGPRMKGPRPYDCCCRRWRHYASFQQPEVSFQPAGRVSFQPARASVLEKRPAVGRQPAGGRRLFIFQPAFEPCSSERSGRRSPQRRRRKHRK